MATMEPTPDNPKTLDREYIVLSAGADVEKRPVWYDVGRASATNAKQAMAEVVETLPEDEREGTFVAVPVRNWTPLTRKTETVVKASWS